jgi:hypothetical protein
VTASAYSLRKIFCSEKAALLANSVPLVTMLTQLKTFAHDHLFICNEIHDLARLYLSFGHFHLYRSSVFQSFWNPWASYPISSELLFSALA